MCFLKRLFSKKVISSVKIIDHKDGLDEDDKMNNLAIGDMVDGFDGMVIAELYNEDNSAETTFEVNYTDGTTEYIVTQDGDSDYNYYIKFVED